MFLSLSSLFLAIIFIQTGASFAKSLFPLAGAGGASLLRLFFAGLILSLIWRPWRLKLRSHERKNLILYGASLGLMNLSFYFALARIPLGIAVTLEFVGPLSLSLISSRKKMDFIWACLAGLGIYLVMPTEDIHHHIDLLGVLFALTAGLFWAFYIHYGKKAGENFHGASATTIGMIVAFLIVLPFGLYLDGDKIFNLELVPMGILVGLLSSALPYSLEMYSLKRIPAKTFGVLMSMEPAIASLAGLMILGEKLTGQQVVAIFFIMTACLGSTLSLKNN
jgi:inner membrane transporter RhtA